MVFWGGGSDVGKQAENAMGDCRVHEVAVRKIRAPGGCVRGGAARPLFARFAGAAAFGLLQEAVAEFGADGLRVLLQPRDLFRVLRGDVL